MSISSLQSKLLTKQALVVELNKQIKDAKRTGQLRIMEDLRAKLADVTRDIISTRNDLATARDKKLVDDEKRKANVGL